MSDITCLTTLSCFQKRQEQYHIVTPIALYLITRIPIGANILDIINEKPNHMYCYVAFGFIVLFTNKIHLDLMDFILNYLHLLLPLYMHIFINCLHLNIHYYYYIIDKLITYISHVLSTHKYKLIATICNGLFADRVHGLHVYNYKIIKQQYIHTFLNYLYLIICSYCQILLLK